MLASLPACLPACLHPQSKEGLNHEWHKELKRLLPWLSSDSKTLSLVYRDSLLHQALNVAYARHDAVSGKPACRLPPINSSHCGGVASMQHTKPQII